MHVRSCWKATFQSHVIAVNISEWFECELRLFFHPAIGQQALGSQTLDHTELM
jgi:hypothetical protein